MFKAWSKPTGFYVKIMRFPLICLPLLLILSTHSACTRTVLVEGSLPTPLVKKISARVGVYYSEEFRSYLHKEDLPQSGTYHIDLGDQNLNFFRNLSTALFTEVIEIDAPELSDEQRLELDAIFIPKIVEYGFLVPAISTLAFHEVSIKYEIQLKDRYGKSLGEWVFVGYGKAESERFGSSAAVKEATVLAIRDGGARIATEIAPFMSSVLDDAEVRKRKELIR